MRLTDEMKSEIKIIGAHVYGLRDKSDCTGQLDLTTYPCTYACTLNPMEQNLLHEDEIQLLKVKLENFYSETDVKEVLNL